MVNDNHKHIFCFCYWCVNTRKIFHSRYTSPHRFIIESRKPSYIHLCSIVRKSAIYFKILPSWISARLFVKINTKFDSSMFNAREIGFWFNLNSEITSVWHWWINMNFYKFQQRYKSETLIKNCRFSYYFSFLFFRFVSHLPFSAFNIVLFNVNSEIQNEMQINAKTKVVGGMGKVLNAGWSFICSKYVLVKLYWYRVSSPIQIIII